MDIRREIRTASLQETSSKRSRQLTPGFQAEHDCLGFIQKESKQGFHSKGTAIRLGGIAVAANHTSLVSRITQKVRAGINRNNNCSKVPDESVGAGARRPPNLQALDAYMEVPNQVN